MHQVYPRPQEEGIPPDKLLKEPVGPDALPALLREKLYRAWDLEKAKAFEPELEELLAGRLEMGDQAGYDELVDHYVRLFNDDIRANRRERWTRRMWGLTKAVLVTLAAAAFKMIAAALFPPHP